LPFRDAVLEELPDPAESLVERRLVHLAHPRREAGLRTHLRDARAHEAAADDAHRLHARPSFPSRMNSAAKPSPPVTQSVASPSRASRRPISWRSVVTMRAPVAPIGWPSAIAPPFTLSFAWSSPRSRSHAITCAANASLSSISS